MPGCSQRADDGPRLLGHLPPSLKAPGVNICAQSRSPKRPHRVRPVCGSYKGREVVHLQLKAA